MPHPDDRQLAPESLCLRLVEALVGRGLSLAVAESVTGGLVAASLTSIPGVSACLRGGVVAYSDAIKVGVLGVPQDLIQRHTSVSAEVAVEMARCARLVMGADLAVATTGEAGPVSGSGRPVGTVFVASCDGIDSDVTRLQLNSDRCEVRRVAVERALDLVLARVLR